MEKLNIRTLRTLLFKQCNDTGNKKTGAVDAGAVVVAPPPGFIPPSEPCRRLLPAALFLLTFFTVMTMLLVYMDTTAMRQQQFRLNMSREYELAGVAQDDAALVDYIRHFHLASATQRFPPHARHSPPPPPQPSQPTLPETLLAQLLSYKRGGIFVEAGAYSGGSGGGSRTEWLERVLSWRGLLLTPDARDYFRLRGRRTAPGTLVSQACLSTSTHPKEITYQESSSLEEVGVLAIGGGGAEEFSARVKCFPLYSLLLAAHAQHADFLSLSCAGCQLAALSSLPPDKVHISVVEIVGKEVPGIDALLKSRGYSLAAKTTGSTIYAHNDIPTLKI